MSVPIGSTGWQLLDEALNSIPAGAGINPYAYVLATLEDYYEMQGNAGDSNRPAFVINMSVILALYAICLFATIFTLVIKAKHGSLWLFRRRSTLHGTLICCNTMALWTMWSAIFVSCSSIYIGLLIAALRRQISAVPAQSIMAVIWIPMCLSLFTEAHGMLVAIYLSKPEQRLFGWTIHASVINVIAIAFYILEPLALIPLFALAANTTQRSNNALSAFASWLSLRAARWNGSAAFSLDAAGAQIIDSLDSASSDVGRYLGDGFKVFLFCILASAIVFVPAAFGYLKLLNQQIRGNKSMRPTPCHSNEKRFINSAASKQSDRLESLAVSYRLMIVELVLVFFCIICYSCLNGWAGFWISSIMGNGDYVILQHALFYYVFAVLGTPVNLLVAYRSWTAYQADQYGAHGSGSNGSSRQRFDKSIEVETVVYSDQAGSKPVPFGGKAFLELESRGSIDQPAWSDEGKQVGPRNTWI